MKKRHPCTLNRMGAFSISVTCCSQQKFSVFHNAELLALPRCADDSYLFSQRVLYSGSGQHAHASLITGKLYAQIVVLISPVPTVCCQGSIAGNPP